MNDQQLHRKQIVMLVLATALAIGSLWIPLPRPAEPQPSRPVSSEPGTRIAPIDSMTFVPEPATVSRFSVMASSPWPALPADLIARDKAQQDDGRSGPPSSLKLNAHDLANGDKIKSGNPPLAPIKDFDRAVGR